MALPLVAVVGRPNVGKSAFVNRIAGGGEAIVHEMRGVTRDRSYHDTEWNGVRFVLVDTGGIEVQGADQFQASIREQALTAAREADAIVVLVDGAVGVMSEDEQVARLLRHVDKPIMLAVNKMDRPGVHDAVWDFYQLGLGEPWPISALHGHGTGDLLDALVARLAESGAVARAAAQGHADDGGVNVAIIGRPNAGKSSLTNQMAGFDRSIVSDVAGTTRDAVDTRIEHDGRTYTIVDTAGMRRKSKIDQDVEYYGFVRAMRAIDRADVALLVVDGTLGLTDQDQRVAGYADARGCGMVIVLNKWDAVDSPEDKERVRDLIADRMTFVQYAPVVAISALTGKNVNRVWTALDAANEARMRTLSTSALNAWLQDIREFGHTVSRGRAHLSVKYMTQTGTCPPRFTLFANRPDLVDDNYERYLENRMRQRFDLEGTPIRFKFKKKD